MRVTVVVAVALAASAALAAAPRAARADEPLKPTAKVRFDAGVQLTTAGRYDDAIREFRAAYSIDPSPVLFYSLAVAERLAGRCGAAVDYYQRFLRTNPNERRTEAARTGIDLCRQSTAPEARPWYRNPAAAAIAGGVLGLTAGTGFLITASSTRDRASSAQFSDDFEAALDRATGQRRTGAVLLVLGAALTGGGIAYIARERRRGPPAVTVGLGARSIYIARWF